MSGAATVEVISAVAGSSRTAGWVIPKKGDPRIPFAGVLTTYAFLGCTVLGFNRTPLQMLLTVVAGCALDMLLHWLFSNRERLVPLSAFISMTSIALLLNYAHNYYLLFLPVFFTIVSKYVLTFRGRHVFNPSLFGLVCALILGKGLYSSAPAYQWGGSLAIVAFMITAACALFVFRIRRTPLIVSFVSFYTLETLLRAYILRDHLPLQTMLLGTLTSARLYLFTFYMLTDPKTSPSGKWQQIAWSFSVVLADLWFHTIESLSTLFYALFLVSAARFFWLHLLALCRERWGHLKHALDFELAARVAACATMGVAGFVAYGQVIHPRLAINDPGFEFVAVPSSISGIDSQMSGVMNDVDPRVRHFAKWLMSVGDAIAIGDFDNDGLEDIFLTNPLKRPEDRNILYRNLGNYRFARVEIPALREINLHPEKYGFAAGALFVDYDNSGAQSLLLTFAYGKNRLLKNMLPVTGKAEFVDVTNEAGIGEHSTSVAATFFDYDRDGKLDLLIANSFSPYLRDYPQATRLNIFSLPQPEFAGDRRMFHFMHESWSNANNGGLNLLFHNSGGGQFQKLDMATVGMPETHFTLAVGTGDLNGDGYTDLYCANDFGPDDLYLNDQGRRFVRIEGKVFGSVGKDTYKGMNVSIGDLDNRGQLDIYVSNVHVPLQAEGSLLWKTHLKPSSFIPEFRDEATGRGLLNEGGFGWGAAMGDLNLDGWLDVVQANGMADDLVDHRFSKPRNYWYAAEKVMLAPPDIHSYVDRWPDLRGYEIFGHQPNRVYLSRGDETSMQYIDVASQVGLTQLGNSRGIALADFNNDGVLDMAITHQFAPMTLYRNTLHEQDLRTGQVHHWLGLAVEGDGVKVSREAVGTQVFLSYRQNGRRVRQMREVQIANGFSAQNDRRLLFGLGDYEGPVELEVHWYGAETAVLGDLPPNHYHVIRYRPPLQLAKRGL
jgi:enediyne biosynthesis protein E4